MALDVNLILDSGQTVTADSNTTYIEVEGGALAWVRAWFGAMSGGSTTCDVRVMFSLDAGSNYYMAGKFQVLGPTNDNAYMAIPVYLPRPTSAANKVRVRINYDVGGASPSYAVTKIILDPIVSLATPAIDEATQTGAVSLIGAT